MYIIFTAGNAAALEIVGPSNAIYIDIAGSNATGTRGNAARPFLTFEGAMTVAQSGDEILFGPGTFSSGNKPAATANVANLTIRGSGELVGGTIMTADTGIDVLATNAGNRSLLIQDLRLAAVGTGNAFSAVGGASAVGAFMNAGLKLENVDITVGTGLAMTITEANETVLFNVQTTGACAFLTSSNVRVRGGTSLGAIQHTWDNTDANKPAAQTVGLQIAAASSIGALTSTGQTLMSSAAGSTVASMTGNALSVSGGILPSFTVGGTVGIVDFQSSAAKRLPDPGGANLITLNFAGANLTGATFSAAVTGANSQNLYLTNATAKQPITFLGDSRAIMLMRGAGYDAPTYTTSNTLATATGAIMPPFFASSTNNAGATTAIAFGFTAPTATYFIALSNSVATATPINWASKAVTGFNVTLGGTPGVAVIDVYVTW